MPRNDALYYVDAKEARNNFLYAPATKPNANNFLYTCYGTNGPVAMSDPDALSLATLGNVTVAAERLALNKLALDLKAANLWAKMHAIYPMTPNTGSLNVSYSLNLKNATQHQLTIPADFTCTPAGLRNNSNTLLQCTSSTLNWDVVAIENMSIGVYYRTYGRNDSAQVDAAISNGSVQSFLQSRNATGTGLSNEAGFVHYVGGNLSNGLSGLAGSPGLHTLVRNNLVTTYYVESSTILSSGGAGTLVTQPAGGVFSLGNKAAAPISFAFVGQALTQAEIVTLQNIIDTYQNTLTSPRSFRPAQLVDVDASVFATAAQLLRWRHVEIVSDLTSGLKTDNIWSLLNVLYPFVGMTALAHSINLKNPGQYQITWGGSLLHTAQGVVGSPASNGIGITGFVQTTNEAYLGLYVNQSSGPQVAHDWGAFVPNSISSNLHYQWVDSKTYLDLGSQAGAGRTSVFRSASVGYVAGSRVGTTQSIYADAAQIHTGIKTDNNVSTATYKLFRGSDASCPDRTYAMAVASSGLTLTQHTLLYNRIQAFQQALGRAV